MKKTLLASAALALIAAAPARAADIQSAPGPDAPLWSGFYIGVEGGYAHSDFDLDGSAALDGGHKDDGILGGVYVGHDWQSGHFVFGAVADFDFVDLHDDFESIDPVSGKGETYSYDVDWVATARARAGYAAGPYLFYGTGGVAFADIDAQTQLITGTGGPLTTSTGKSSDIEVGGVLGAGIEYAFSPKFSGKLEYQHFFFDDVAPGPGGSGARFDPSFDTVKVGLAYRF